MARYTAVTSVANPVSTSVYFPNTDSEFSLAGGRGSFIGLKLGLKPRFTKASWSISKNIRPKETKSLICCVVSSIILFELPRFIMLLLCILICNELYIICEVCAVRLVSDDAYTLCDR